MQAQVLTEGQSAAATKELNAEFQLLEAAKVAYDAAVAQGTTTDATATQITNQQIQAYTTLRASMGAQQALAAAGITLNSQAAASFNTVTTALGQAAAAAEKAKIDTTINFTAGTIGLNDNELQIAQQLKTLYGNDIPAALNSAEAAQMRLNQSLADAKTYAVDFSQALMQGLQQGLSGMAALGYAAVQTANQIANQFAKLGTQNIFGGITSGNTNQLLSGIGSLGVGIGLSFLTGQAQQVQQAQQQWQQAQQTWQNEQAGFAEFTASLTGDDAAAERPGASLATWRLDHRHHKAGGAEKSREQSATTENHHERLDVPRAA